MEPVRRHVLRALLCLSLAAVLGQVSGTAQAQSSSRKRTLQTQQRASLALSVKRLFAPSRRKPPKAPPLRRKNPPPPPPPLPPPPPPPVPPPPPPPPGGTTRPGAGVQFHCNWSIYDNNTRRAVLDKMQAAGVQWVRIDTAWDGMEDTAKGARNSWYIGMVDFCVNEARARGMKVLITLWLSPSWARSGGTNRMPATNPQDYADFAQWAAAHWRGRVSAWEVWNEPDQSAHFNGTFDQYVAMLRAAYPAFKAGDPNAQVVLGGPSSNDDDYMRRIYAAGGGSSFDVLATHPYQAIGDAPPERIDDGHRWWFSHVPAVRQVMVANGDAAKPIWFTEFGWSAHPNGPSTPNWQRGVTQAQQADYIVRAYEYARTSFPYVTNMFWYKERANPQSTDEFEEGFALLDSNLAERPVYRALTSYLHS